MISRMTAETRNRLYNKLQAYAQEQAAREWKRAWNALTESEKRKRNKNRLYGKPNKQIFSPPETAVIACEYSQLVLREDLTVEQEELIKVFLLARLFTNEN